MNTLYIIAALLAVVAYLVIFAFKPHKDYKPLE